MYGDEDKKKNKNKNNHMDFGAKRKTNMHENERIKTFSGVNWADAKRNRFHMLPSSEVAGGRIGRKKITWHYQTIKQSHVNIQGSGMRYTKTYNHNGTNRGVKGVNERRVNKVNDPFQFK